MDKIIEYLSVRANRERVITFIGVFSVIGGVIFSTLMLLAILTR